MRTSLVLLSVLVAAGTACADPVILPIFGGGSIHENLLNEDGSFNSTGHYHDLSIVCNNQPTALDAMGVPTGQPYEQEYAGPGWGGGWGYLDLGPDWQDLRIMQTWTLGRQWADGPATPYVQVWWEEDDVQDWIQQVGEPLIPGATAWWQTYLEIPANAVQDTQVNFVTQPTSGWMWKKDLDLPENQAIAAAGRYLIMQSPDPLTTASEFALVGYVVPEPASMGLLAFAGLVALLRRKR